MAIDRFAELDKLRTGFLDTKMREGIDPEIRRMLFRNNGLFDAITTEMTTAEVPAGQIVVVTDKEVRLEPDFTELVPPLTYEEFVEKIERNGEFLLGVTNPRTNPTVSASASDNPAALGNL